MMATTIRADQVGSLLRPPELLAARASFEKGHISGEEFRKAEDEAILTALELQREAGVEVFTDGEYRRTTFLAPLSQGMEGLMKDPNTASATALRWQGPKADLANAVNAEASDLMQVVGGRCGRRLG
jgi:methionine synthase II (cobalamin-independent)